MGIVVKGFTVMFFDSHWTPLNHLTQKGLSSINAIQLVSAWMRDVEICRIAPDRNGWAGQLPHYVDISEDE